MYGAVPLSCCFLPICCNGTPWQQPSAHPSATHWPCFALQHRAKEMIVSKQKTKAFWKISNTVVHILKHNRNKLHSMHYSEENSDLVNGHQTFQGSQAMWQIWQFLPSSLWHIHIWKSFSHLKVKHSVLSSDFNFYSSLRSMISGELQTCREQLNLLPWIPNVKQTPRTTVAHPLCSYLIPFISLLTTSRG